MPMPPSGHFLLPFLLLLLPFVPSVHASYCGQSAIPFSLEVRADGQPVLGCARPACFGWTPDGRRAADIAQFYRIWGRPDGFVRVADLGKQKGAAAKNGSGAEYSICERHYGRDRCGEGTWVGGIAPAASIGPENPLKLLCCSYPKLAQSVPSSHVQVRAGQVLQGGEVLDRQGGSEVAFEYIANLQRLFDRQGVVYVVEVRKFACNSPKTASTEAETEAGGMRITATFDDDDGKGRNGEEKDGRGETGEELLDEASEPAELRIGQQNGAAGTRKEDEQKILAEFSEYEEDNLLLKGQQNGQKQVDGGGGHPIAPQQKSSSHIHIGRIGPKLGAKEMKTGGNDAISEEEEMDGQWRRQNGQQEEGEKRMEQAAAPIHHAMANFYQPYNKPAMAPPPNPSQQAPQLQSPPSLMSPSPFGGYQMDRHLLNQQPVPSAYSHNQQQHPWPSAPFFLQPNPIPIDNGKSPFAQPTLNPAAPLPLISSPLFGGAEAANGNHPANGRQSLLKIPSPEEIENAIPPHGKLLLGNLARTFLGLQRLF